MSITRRSFLLGLGAASLIPNLGWATNSGDYKALVCLVLQGGNDGFNMLIPTNNQHHEIYRSSRKSISIEKSTILPTKLKAVDRYGDEVSLGLHPSMGEIAELCNKEHLHAIVNCGVLKMPMSKEDINLAPNMLFSHSSQTEEWNKGNAVAHETSGWANRLFKHISINNTILPPLFSFNGQSSLLAGSQKYNALSPSNSATMDFTLDSLRQEFANGLNSKPKTELHKHFRNMMRDSLYASKESKDIFSYSDIDTLNNPSNPLSIQLNSVMKFIRAREYLGQNRQVFMVKVGGYDTHSNQLSDHSALLKKLSQSLGAFYNSLESYGLNSEVTTVTMSEFGRRIVPNATGTDHGWGNNQLVINGGLARSGTTGTWPSLKVGGQDDFQSGHILPTTSVDQIGATLAQWMGVAPADIDKVFPNIGSFSPQLLDFI
ncbi:DUF1501 domain-containing protein [Vibrio sp. NTOU-M3]|uniref:DUF1501 domain-containing protein n=1 Tax=Vibrio sp. NTOU-M3 TaxID=3234954 RepID=UPI00349F6C05